MIFGRKKRQGAEEPKDREAVESAVDAQEAERDDVDAGPDAPQRSEAEVAMEKAEAQWQQWDDEFDREEGPFDIDEVDLDADDVKRLDLGAIIVTPFDGMTLQLQVNQQQVPQAIVVSDGESAMEVALFGAPSRSAYVPEVRREMIASGSQAQGVRMNVRRGPFGTEIARAVPVQNEQGQVGMQITRTWLVEGPSWVLRGVVFGKAALEPDNEDLTITLQECFANMVVRRGTAPVAPGAVIPFSLPEQPQAES